MNTKMETYYWLLVSLIGRFVTLQMIWWASGYICRQAGICSNEK